jgi:hypothetical protein
MKSGWHLWFIPFHKRFRNRPQSSRCDLTVPYFCFPPFECISTNHPSDGFGNPINFRFTCWIPFICHSFLNLRSRFSRLCRPGRSLLRSDSVILLVDSLYAEAIEAVNSWATLSPPSPELISIVGAINPETRIWNSSQSVNLSTSWLLLEVEVTLRLTVSQSVSLGVQPLMTATLSRTDKISQFTD